MDILEVYSLDRNQLFFDDFSVSNFTLLMALKYAF